MYLDPGFGGMMIQVLFVLVAAGGALIFAMRKKIKALFTKKDGDKSAQKGLSSQNAENLGEEDDLVDSLAKKKRQ